MTTALHHLPDATRLGRLQLQVSDLERSLAYYERVLGFRVLGRTAADAELGAADGGPLLELHERRGSAPARPDKKLGLYHFAILLPDRAALGRFVAHLAETGARAGASDHVVSEALYLEDPDGLGIEVYADRPRSSWQSRHGELAMDTTPLDVDSVVSAARGEAWTGMPAGTKVGHVHLHVGDLAAAEAFYGGGLGLDVTVRGYPGALFFAAGGYHHHLGVNVWAGTRAQPAGPDDARLLAWELVLPSEGDVGAAAAAVERAGYAVSRSGNGFTVTDPWGTTLRVSAASTAGRP